MSERVRRRDERDERERHAEGGGEERTGELVGAGAEGPEEKCRVNGQTTSADEVQHEGASVTNAEPPLLGERPATRRRRKPGEGGLPGSGTPSPNPLPGGRGDRRKTSLRSGSSL